MNRDNICDFIQEHQYDDDKDSVLIDSQETAFIGYIRTEEGMSAVYSYSKIIDNLMSDNMTYEEANEYFYFNVSGSYVGDKTPIWCFDNCLINQN